MSNYPEEPLNSSVGYIPTKPGETLSDGKYTVLRKLGWGSRSSTWLVADKDDDEWIPAAKIFTVEATEDGSAEDEKQIYESGLGPPQVDVPTYRDSFEQESARGNHLVLLFVHIGPSVEDLRLSNPSGYLPVHIVKRIINRVLSILATLHGDWSMVHGAVKAGNVLISGPYNADDIRARLEAVPTASAVDYIQGDLEAPYPIVRSQPLDHGYQWNSSPQIFCEADIQLASLGHAYRAKNKQELAKDVQDVGLMTFHLLTGTPLFPGNHEAIAAHADVVSKVEDLLKESGKIDAADIAAPATFLKKCLKVNPSEVPGAFDLLGDDWLEEEFVS